LRRPCDDRAIAEAASRQGINVSPLSMQYRHGRPRHGLVMGFAAVDVATTGKAMAKLGLVLKAALGG
jgi:GntR family transcriptional regulator/MocR family aminotransferase